MKLKKKEDQSVNASILLYRIGSKIIKGGRGRERERKACQGRGGAGSDIKKDKREVQRVKK